MKIQSRKSSHLPRKAKMGWCNSVVEWHETPVYALYSCSIFTTESTGIITVLNLTPEYRIKDGSIFSDSLSVINGIKNKYNPLDIRLYIQNKIVVLLNSDYFMISLF